MKAYRPSTNHLPPLKTEASEKAWGSDSQDAD